MDECEALDLLILNAEPHIGNGSVVWQYSVSLGSRQPTDQELMAWYRTFRPSSAKQVFDAA